MHHKAEKIWWQGRVDNPEDSNTFRWHQVVDINLEQAPDHNVSSTKIALVGYASDLGTQINQGRIGSAEGPQFIRRALANFASHSPAIIYDAGDFSAESNDVESLQKEVAHYISDLKKEQFFTIIIGGSHDLSFSHFYGVDEVLREMKSNPVLGVINLDAHLDLRPYYDGPHSGSPFRQIGDHCSNQDCRFHYLCAGVQKASNTKALYEFAHEREVVIIDSMDFNWHYFEQIKSKLLKFIGQLDYVILSIDLDVFRAGDAPGVSAPAVIGIDPDLLASLLPPLFETGKAVGLDIAETNPGFDIDHRTSRLAAAFIHQVVGLLR
jgi:formiminoglutamase